LVHSGRGQPYVLVWQTRGATQATLNGRPVAPRDRVALRAPLHSATYRLVATSGARGATASLRLVVDGHTPDRHAFVLTTPDIATFTVLRRKGQLEAIWRVRDAVHVWLQGRLVSSTGAAPVPAGASWLRLVASNDVGSRQRLLRLVRLVPPATPRPRRAATPTPRPTATPVPPPTATPVPPPTATPTPRPSATSTPRPSATPTARPTRTPTPVSITIGTTRPPAVSTPRPSATPTPVSVTIGSAAPPSRRRVPQAR
jgi:hypothetical protein